MVLYAKVVIQQIIVISVKKYKEKLLVSSMECVLTAQIILIVLCATIQVLFHAMQATIFKLKMEVHQVHVRNALLVYKIVWNVQTKQYAQNV
jgi:hypothetical protein